jgi:hypothetical protein
MNLECCKTTSVTRPGRRHGVGIFGVALLSLALVGCAEATPDRTPVFPAKGTITFKGQPIPGALVALHPKTPAEGTPNPRANVDKEGAFKVTTYVTADGAPEGDYAVTVLWYKPVKSGADVVSGPNVIPAKYANPNTSDLIVSIKPGENDLPTIAL